MINKISKLKNFGIFHNFSWRAELPEFKRFNLIYGWNRSGKTTISRVFASCEKKCVYDTERFKQYPENGEFEIKASDNRTIRNTDVATSSLPVKVFNKDFIDKNISFDPLNSSNPIVYVSEKDIKSKEKLEKLKSNQGALEISLREAKQDKKIKEQARSNFLTGLGREIANVLFDKSYNKTKAERKIDSVGIDNFGDKELSDNERKEYEETSKSEPRNNQTLLPKYQFAFSFDGEEINDFQKIFNAVKKLTSKEVVSETLDRLKDDQVLSNWVKQGFDLHKERNEEQRCLFCQKSLDDDFLSTISKHFSRDYEDLQNAIGQLKDKTMKIKLVEIPVKKDDLYPNLKEQYASKAGELNAVIKKINLWLDEAYSKLEEKHNNPLVFVGSPRVPDDFFTLHNKSIDDLNNIISDHNNRVVNHSKEVRNAREKLELHSIAVALSNQDYKKLNEELQKAEAKEEKAFGAVKQNDSKISELEEQTSNIGKAIKEINKHLKEFFGREEIKLELDENKKGYTIKRYGRPAKNLSEGEKTAIAFSYFIVKIKEKEFKIRDGIVFIDDPISSFDSNFIYHCFSLISTHFKNVGQLFISTHNFQLFNLVKDWFINKNERFKRDEKKAKSEFFMVENYIESDVRKAKLVELDKTLRNHKSEYHFLFAKLKEFSERRDTEYGDFYTIGNMARRFFDIFVDFKVPKLGDQRSKMEVLLKNINEKEEKISAVDAGKVYKLINEFSHNSDPTSTIEHKDKTESKESIKILLTIVKESDPKHYEILEKNLI